MVIKYKIKLKLIFNFTNEKLIMQTLHDQFFICKIKIKNITNVQAKKVAKSSCVNILVNVKNYKFL